MNDLSNIKIIGIGLPKTGTNTLAAACEILGVQNIAHRPEGMLQQYRDTGSWDMGKRGAVFDINPWPLRAMVDAYPDARFIHTVRPVDLWLASCQRHFQPSPFINPLGRLEIFGVCKWAEGVFRETHYRHGRFVDAFSSAEKGFYVMQFEIGRDGWRELCQFLGVPVPSVPFPHLNKSTEEKRIPWTPIATTGR